MQPHQMSLVDACILPVGDLHIISQVAANLSQDQNIDSLLQDTNSITVSDGSSVVPKRESPMTLNTANSTRTTTTAIHHRNRIKTKPKILLSIATPKKKKKNNKSCGSVAGGYKTKGRASDVKRRRMFGPLSLLATCTERFKYWLPTQKPESGYQEDDLPYSGRCALCRTRDTCQWRTVENILCCNPCGIAVRREISFLAVRNASPTTHKINE